VLAEIRRDPMIVLMAMIPCDLASSRARGIDAV